MAKVEFKVPAWVEKRYSLLWGAFSDSEFNIDQAAKILEDKNQDKREEIPVYLSEMRKAGWLTDEPDPSDARKRIYKLKSKEKIIGEIFALNNNKLDRGEVEGLLKKAADLIRTRVDYKFILILLFLKRFSDKWELEYEKAVKEAVEDGLSEDEAKEEAKNAAYHDFDFPSEFLWDNI
ncbi:MAG: type I restriction-modification system subunit M N-terminal domain-containing protein, partial [Candidatus Methanoperedens sp.]|nr:type I restriction-modification system subunit M N-terminal domain-containing protein [Candidatus Methanoperedens sp.]